MTTRAPCQQRRGQSWAWHQAGGSYCTRTDAETHRPASIACCAEVARACHARQCPLVRVGKVNLAGHQRRYAQVIGMSSGATLAAACPQGHVAARRLRPLKVGNKASTERCLEILFLRPSELPFEIDDKRRRRLPVMQCRLRPVPEVLHDHHRAWRGCVKGLLHRVVQCVVAAQCMLGLVGEHYAVAARPGPGGQAVGADGADQDPIAIKREGVVRVVEAVRHERARRWRGCVPADAHAHTGGIGIRSGRAHVYIVSGDAVA